MSMIMGVYIRILVVWFNHNDLSFMRNRLISLWGAEQTSCKSSSIVAAAVVTAQ